MVWAVHGATLQPGNGTEHDSERRVQRTRAAGLHGQEARYTFEPETICVVCRLPPRLLGGSGLQRLEDALRAQPRGFVFRLGNVGVGGQGGALPRPSSPATAARLPGTFVFFLSYTLQQTKK